MILCSRLRPKGLLPLPLLFSLALALTLAERSAHAEEPSYGDALIIGSLGEASNLIPYLSSDAASSEIAGHLYVAPLKYDKDLNVVPWAAEHFEILDEGRLTDNRGKATNFRNAIIVMTSNTGVENLNRTANIGFSTTDDTASKEEDLIMQGLKKRFRPEFINRIDNIVVFNSLEFEDVIKIATLRVGELERKMDTVGVRLVIETSVIRHIVEKGYNREFGARPIKRLIQTQLEDPIAEALLSQKSPKHCRVTMNGEELEFKFDNA